MGMAPHENLGGRCPRQSTGPCKGPGTAQNRIRSEASWLKHREDGQQGSRDGVGKGQADHGRPLLAAGGLGQWPKGWELWSAHRAEEGGLDSVVTVPSGGCSGEDRRQGGVS